MHACDSCSRYAYSRSWTSVPPLAELEQALSQSCQLWIISSSQQFLSEEHFRIIQAFFREGKGLFIWGDNEPYYADANFISGKLLNTTMTGNLRGDKVVRYRQHDSTESGFTNHDITTGLQFLYEGNTIASIQPGPGVQPLIYGSAGNIVTAYYNNDGCRCILDGGFTRLFCQWNAAGQPRFVVNCAAWLANLSDVCGI
jgi:hypothetical protein